MKDMRLAFTLTFAALTLAAQAGLKYWTGGGYDADSYVQDGLVLNYDGIRNVGLTTGHSATTTTWKNLGNGGATYDLSRANWTEGRGAWEDDGYRFTTEVGKAAHFDSPSITWNLSGQNRTIQIACDINRTDRQCETTTRNLGYIFYGMSGTKCSDNDPWRWFSVGVRSDNGTSSGVYSLACNLAYTYAVGDHFDYVTSILGDDYVSTFTGTTPPTSGTANTGYSKDASKRGDMATITKFTLGGSNSQGLTGKIKNVRYYNRVLEKEEIAWNRAVDDARFFGQPVLSIPATNAVIASSISAVSGNEASGAYAVDAAGYVFSAPAATNVNGRAYACTGYTLETWDAATGGWGTPESHVGELSCAATETSRIRITWQWTPGDGLVTYDVGDYVQGGLVLHYDGIRNAGAGRPHSATTRTWVNLAAPGGHDLTYRTADTPAWTADGCKFPASTVFLGGAFTVPSACTTQAAVDALPRDLSASLGYIWFSSGDGNKNWTKWSCSVRQADAIWFNTHYFTKDRPKWSTTPHIAYFTGIANETYTAAFAGTEEPTNAPGRYACGDGTNCTAFTVSGWSVGGDGGGGQMLAGTVKNFRFYSRVLTKAELAHNRMVDNARFYGVLPETNVVVASSHLFLPGNEADGQYQVSGSYVFTAPETASDRGVDYALDGYTVETWTNGEWGPATKHEGASYAYATTAGKVRLTWQWKATRGLRTAADYDVQDYAGAGLFLNYDGLRNVGAGVPHNANANKWANLAPSGAFYDIALYSGTKAWLDDGFPFAKDKRFYAWNGFVVPTHYTFQTLVDARPADHENLGYVFFPPQRGDDNSFWMKCSIGIRKNANGASILANSFYLVNDTPMGGRPCIVGEQFTYATAMMCGDHSVMFAGTEAPTSGTIATGYKAKGSGNTPTPYELTPFAVGWDFWGTIKNLRYYDRVLTTAELERNRNVDAARYFGALATTNVFVEACGGAQAEAGAYKVEGAWTFTATTAAKKNGTLVPVTRYTVETLTNGEWTNKEWHDGASYTYTEGTDPAAVRLTWHGQPEGAMIVIR
ncbi:MAG: hypothetical protein IJ658_10230 [Kiritimatiellae bacterium]|nr:hypothetical protein [Kiritimatiellia bacterium]